MDKMVQDILKQYDGHLQPKPSLESVQKDLNKQAVAIMDRIISNYNHSILRWFA